MSKSLLSKIRQAPILSRIFNFLSKKRAVKVTLINKKLSAELNLTIDEYLLEDENYRKIVLRSKGFVNEICVKVFKYYKECDNNLIPFPEMVKKIVKYMKYLYVKKTIKYYTIILEYFFSMYWTHASFLLEVIRSFKKGISFESGGLFYYKYYDIFKDAILNLEEVHSTSNYLINRINKVKGNSIQLYYEMFDWTKVRCLDLMKFPKGINRKQIPEQGLLIPDNANFRKIKIDDCSTTNCNQLVSLMAKHGGHVEHLKIYNFKDTNVYLNFFSNLTNIKKVKFIKSQCLSFHNFLVLFKKYLSQIKILVLDKMAQSQFKNLSEQKDYFYVLQNVLPRLNHLEKLEMNFSQINNISDIYKLLSSIVSQNPCLKELKIGLTFSDKKDQEKKKKESIFMEQFIGKEADLEEYNLKQFYTLVKEISALKKLSNLELNFELDDKMTQIVSTFLNVGENLKNLSLIHTRRMNVTQLLNSHPNLNIISLCLDEKDNEDTKIKFNYEFSQRPWKSITLKNYPLNNSFIEAIIKAKNSLKDLTLENTINSCEKSNGEVSNILLAIKNNII